jgi:mannose-6-phosphate isomerase-like protein (cupin superfamily)
MQEEGGTMTRFFCYRAAGVIPHPSSLILRVFFWHHRRYRMPGGAQMKVKSTLKVINQKNYKGRRGVTDGQTYQRLVGWPEVFMTDRVRLGRATYKPGTYEQLHWHPIEACYYVISGHATVRDINGKQYPVSAGSIIYAPAGIAGAHEWEVKESLELLDIRATNETNRKIQYTVDKKSKRSFIDLKDLAYREAISFKSHY